MRQGINYLISHYQADPLQTRISLETLYSKLLWGREDLEIIYQLKSRHDVVLATHCFIKLYKEPTSACLLYTSCHLGLRPVWADVMPSPSSEGRVTFLMNGSLDYRESLRTPRTVALIAVNMYGMPCPAVELAHFCKRHQIPWIEDNAQGMGGIVEIVSGCLRTPIPVSYTHLLPHPPRSDALCGSVHHSSPHGRGHRVPSARRSLGSLLDAGPSLARY